MTLSVEFPMPIGGLVYPSCENGYTLVGSSNTFICTHLELLAQQGRELAVLGRDIICQLEEGKMQEIRDLQKV